MFNLTLEELKAKNAIHTATEIFQQPNVWDELSYSLNKQEKDLNDFINSIFTQYEQVHVIFTGAGTSAFIGNMIVPVLQRENNNNIKFDAIPTTDIVSNPEEYLLQDVPTIMVSFARSGNSPESVATVKLGKQIIKNFYQVVITCNEDGQLASDTKVDTNSVTILMPDKAHDKGLAMTSSFTCMLITAYTLFTSRYLDEKVISQAEKLISSLPDKIDEILKMDFERVIYLGSGMLGQLSHEAALKMLELTAGKVAAIHESSLGFRHGPKSFLNEKSLVVLFISQDSYTRKYDMDILRELTEDDSGMEIVAVTERKDEEAEQLAHRTISVNFGKENFLSDFYLSCLYVIVAQTLALKKSLQLGITPDNPSPDGKVNRVVKGVRLYDFE